MSNLLNTSLGTATSSSSNSTSYAGPTGTISANSWCYAVVGAPGTVAAAPTFTNAGTAALTWRLVTSQTYNTTDTLYLFVAFNASSNTVSSSTFTCSSDAATGCYIAVFFTLTAASVNPSCPFTQLVKGSATSTDPTVTLPHTRLATSGTLAISTDQSNPSVVTASTTGNFGNSGSSTPSNGVCTGGEINGGTTATITFTEASSKWGMIAFEYTPVNTGNVASTISTGVTASTIANVYTCTVANGAFTETGEAANLHVGHTVTASNGSFTETGESVTLTYTPGQQTLTITAGNGAFTETGESVSLSVGHKITAGNGSFTETGEPVNLPITKAPLVAANGSFTETGETANLKVGHTVTSSNGSFTETGESVNLSVGHTITASNGSFVETGESVNLPIHHTLTASSGSFTETGEPVNLSVGHRVVAGNGSFAEAGESTTLHVGHTLTLDNGSFSETGESVSFPVGHTITAGNGSFAEIGEPVSLTSARSIAADNGVFVETGENANLTSARSIAASNGAFVETGESVLFPISHTLTAANGSFAETGEPVSLSVGHKIIASNGTFVETGEAAGLTSARSMAASNGTFVETGEGVFLVYSPNGNTTIAAGHGSFVEVGEPVQFPIQKAPLLASQGSFIETGESLEFNRTYNLAADSGSFVEIGEDAALSYAVGGSQYLTMSADTGIASFTGNSLSLSIQHFLIALAASFVLTASNALPSVDRYGSSFPSQLTVVSTESFVHSQLSNMKKNDTSPHFRAYLTAMTELRQLIPVGLTDHSATFIMYNILTGTEKVNAACVIEGPPTAGIVRYIWQSGDTDTIGVYKIVIKTTDLTSGRVRTFPSEGFEYFTIEKNI